mgnify:CR=1 FL=1
MTDWYAYKQKAWDRIIRDKEIGYLDPDIFDVLEVFFKRKDAFTQSSCSGRITIVDAELPWERRNSSVIYKNHLGMSVDDFTETISKGKAWNLWLVVQGPIFHVYNRTQEEAWEILKIARSVGFKHSGILTTNEKGVLVELRTGVKMVHLLKQKYTEEEIDNLVDIANKVLLKGKDKLRKMKNAMESSLDANNSMKLGEDSERKSEVQYHLS